MPTGSILSLPNVISLSRVGLAAAFVAMTEPAQRLALILIAAATDVLDGWLARRSKSTSAIGALIDPIADRLFVFTAVCVYLANGVVNPLQYFVLIFRDIVTAIGFVVAKNVSWLRPITFRARLAGKVVTALQLLTLVALLARRELVNVLIIAIAVTSVIAVIDYTLLLWRERERSAA